MIRWTPRPRRIATTALSMLAVGLVSAAAAQAPESLRPLIAARYSEVRWVSTVTLARWMGQPRPVVLLDAREAPEHAVSHLRGARRIDPDDADPASALSAAPSDARVVVYCSVGWRSAAIADRLREAGHREVYNLEGGIFAWANEDRPVFRGGRRVAEVHPYDELWGRMLRAPLRATSP